MIVLEFAQSDWGKIGTGHSGEVVGAKTCCGNLARGSDASWRWITRLGLILSELPSYYDQLLVGNSNCFSHAILLNNVGWNRAPWNPREV